jgi:prepilin signal peptidase PulO-like enzyme (type II secretory pathway)
MIIEKISNKIIFNTVVIMTTVLSLFLLSNIIHQSVFEFFNFGFNFKGSQFVGYMFWHHPSIILVVSLFCTILAIFFITFREHKIKSRLAISVVILGIFFSYSHTLNLSSPKDLFYSTSQQAKVDLELLENLIQNSF